MSKPFVINRHNRLVFPSNYLGDLDFSVIDTEEQLAAVVRRDFEAKAPSGTEVAGRAESGEYPTRYELLRDLALNLFWVNRYAMTMYEKRPTRWRDVPRNRHDVLLPILLPWQDGDRKVAAIAAAYERLPARWDAEVEKRIYDIIYDVFRHKLHHATELPAVKPTVAEILSNPTNLTFCLSSYDADYLLECLNERYGRGEILDAPVMLVIGDDAAAAILHRQQVEAGVRVDRRPVPGDPAPDAAAGDAAVGEDVQADMGDGLVMLDPNVGAIVSLEREALGKRTRPFAQEHGLTDCVPEQG